MDELARKYLEAHDPEIPYELYKLARELENIEKESSHEKIQLFHRGQAR
jgi:hypothetical protein